MIKDESDKPIALFDLDGTLADFDGSMDEAMKKIATVEEVSNNTYFPREQSSEPEFIKERRRLIKRQPGFWRDLKRSELGFKLLKIAMDLGYQIDVLTKAPRMNFPAWSEKVEWTHKNLPMEEGIRVNLVENKGLFYGKVLVDDFPPYVKAWLEYRPRGLVIMPAHPYNADYQHPQVIRVGLDDEGRLTPSANVVRQALEEQAQR